MSDDEFVAGYLDGRDPDSPTPNLNRSHRYRHSFAVGRAEIEGRETRSAADLRVAATVAKIKDTML